ncbi:MAG: major facilitator superfamily 1 [Frankiales bacterium]|nr:major facilitator superfamily 1 [Frankiales bacterium]
MRARSSIRQVLTTPGVLVTAGPYSLARVGVTMELLALLLFVHDRTGSWLHAGLVNSCFAVGAAVLAPLLGRSVDRRGQTGVLAACALLHAAGVLTVVLAEGRSSAVALAGAGLAGASLPPVSSCMRVLWSSLVPASLRSAAYAIESLLVEVAELAGPAGVGAVVFFVSPTSALLLAGSLVSAGTLVFAASAPSRRWRTQRAVSRPVGLLPSAGPLRVRGVRLLTGVILLSTAGFSALEVSVARFASGQSHAAATGPLLGTMVAGSLLGAWAYGRRPRTSPAPDQLVVLMACSTVLGTAPLFATGLWSMGVLLLVTGVLIAPATSVQFLLMTDVAPEDSRTEAFTWASTAGFLGVAAGTGAAGTVVSAGGARLGILLSSGLALLALLLAARTRVALRPAVVEPVYTVWIEEYEEVVRERDEALEALRRYGERCDAMARELALLRQDPVLGPVAAVAPQQRSHLRAVAAPQQTSVEAAPAELQPSGSTAAGEPSATARRRRRRG